MPFGALEWKSTCSYGCWTRDVAEMGQSAKVGQLAEREIIGLPFWAEVEINRGLWVPDRDVIEEDDNDELRRMVVLA
ncbi:hypothetical protein Nepgr_019647 [Nepenthes gracilis]|uniref:Uncharacterized protein n=1 Tax=Nepenthes gracilis TaxID=150966 RepID=A0AAD3XVJ4_NEPGR|nr:hypothetical protein Nepgr_019647 [Nepenthes gracilis]